MAKNKKKKSRIKRAFFNSSDAWRLLKFNLKPITIYVLIFSIIGGIIGCNFNKAVQKLYRMIINVPFVGDFSAKQYYLDPLYLIVLLSCLLGLTYLGALELGAITRAIRLSKHGKKADLLDMLSEGINDANRFLIPKNWGMALLITIVFPFLQLVSICNLNISLEVPGFINDFINSNFALASLYFVVFIGLCLVALYFVYAIRIFADTEQSFTESCKDSITIVKGNYWRTLLTLVVVELVIGAFIYGAGGLVAIVVYKLMKASNTYSSIDGSAMETAKDIVVFSGYIHMLIMPAVNLATLSSMYYEICNEKGIVEPESIEGKGIRNKDKIITGVIAACFILCSCFVFEPQQWFGFLNLRSEVPQVIAHRGDSTRCPENTIHAFELAIEEGVDWIELDVHQTKDGVIIVSHDENLKRVCGKDVNVHDLTYEEIRELEVGSWFSPEFKGTRLSTLREILNLCKGNTKVQVEIKPTKADKDIEQGVIDVIRECDMVDDVVVLSLKTDPLERIEELAPDINTMYCTVLAFGDVTQAPANWLSVEEHNIDHKLVEEVHQSGRKIFAWTVNNPDTVQHLVDCGVDGILTDDPIMMKMTLGQCDYYQKLLSRFVDFLDAWQIRFF